MDFLQEFNIQAYRDNIKWLSVNTLGCDDSSSSFWCHVIEEVIGKSYLFLIMMLIVDSVSYWIKKTVCDILTLTRAYIQFVSDTLSCAVNSIKGNGFECFGHYDDKLASDLRNNILSLLDDISYFLIPIMVIWFIFQVIELARRELLYYRLTKKISAWKNNL